MKKSIALAVLGLVLAGSAPQAVSTEYPAYLGIYFDEAATIYRLYHIGVIQVYLIMTDPEFAAIKGLECYVEWDEGNSPFLGMALPADGLNIGDQHNIVMGLDYPLVTSQATIMATYTLSPLGPPTPFFISEATSPSIEGGQPVAVDGDDNMFQIGVITCSGCWVAELNPPVDAQDQTWGGIKSLYR